MLWLESWVWCVGGVQAACSGEHVMLWMQCAAQETLGMSHIHSLQGGVFCFIVSLDHAWSVPSAVFFSILPDSTKARPVCTPLTGKALVKWCATTSHHFQMNCFGSVESFLHRRFIKFPFLIVLLGWVAQDLYFVFTKILNERIILRVQITYITGRGKGEVNFSGTSICRQWVTSLKCFFHNFRLSLAWQTKNKKPAREEWL